MRSTQQSYKAGDINKKLDEIKQYVFQLIAEKVRVQKQSDNSQMSVVMKMQENKYAKKIDLEKQNMVLAYEVKLLASLIARLGIREEDQIFQLNENLCNSEIRARENTKDLEIKVQKLEAEIKKLERDKQELQRKVQIQSKATKIWQKKYSEYEKLGGIQKLNQYKQNIKQLANEASSLQKQNSSHKEQIKKLKNKCIILEQLNRQTDQKLSQLMIVNINRSKNKINQAADKENRQDNREQKHNFKIQLLAAKQEIKTLKMKIENLEKLKTNQKMKYEEKESIYQKMVMKNMREL